MTRDNMFFILAEMAGVENVFRYVKDLKRRIKNYYGDDVSNMTWHQLAEYMIKRGEVEIVN